MPPAPICATTSYEASFVPFVRATCLTEYTPGKCASVACLLQCWLRGRCRCAAGVAESERDPSWRVFVRAGGRKFSERVHFAHTSGQVDCLACVELPQMWQGDRSVRQHSCPE